MQCFVQNKKWLIWLFLGLDFLKNVLIEITTLAFVKLQKLIQTEKALNWGPKMLYLGILGWNLKKHFSYVKSEFMKLQSFIQNKKL